jgi:hypothetical protein
VRFEEPQPEGLPDEKSTPKKWWGKYVSEEDSSLLTISSRYLIRTNDKLSFYSRAEFDSLTTELPSKDTIVRFDKIRIEVKKLGEDKFSVHEILQDTLFNFAETKVLRKFKGFYFMSLQEGSSNWIVKKAFLKKNIFTIASITSKEDLINLREITLAKDDSTEVFRPSRKEFRKFVNGHSFTREEKFMKIN